jgi:predicted nucleic acid-binding protein
MDPGFPSHGNSLSKNHHPVNIITVAWHHFVFLLLTSEIVDLEISKIPDEDRKQKVRLLSSIPKMNIVIDDEIISRGKELNTMGFKSFDAFHLACAEKGQADALLTTDDHLLKKTTSQRKLLNVKIENPLKWLMEELVNYPAASCGASKIKT